MSDLQFYKNKLKKLEEDSLVQEYLYLQRLIRLVQSDAYNIRVNKPSRVIPEKLSKLDKIEREEANIVLKLLRYINKASRVKDINDYYFEFYYQEEELKYKIRHQYKIGKIYLLSYNESRKYSFYIMPEWLKNGKLEKKYYPKKDSVPHKIDSIIIRSYDMKINKEML